MWVKQGPTPQVTFAVLVVLFYVSARHVELSEFVGP